MKISLLILFLFASSARLLYCEDWDVNGRTFSNIQVLSVEPDRVHVSYTGGIGTINLSDLTPELKTRFGYDPVKAKAAADAREKDRNAIIASMPPLPAPVVETKPPVAAPAAAPALNPIQRQLILDQIASLQADIAEKTAEVKKNTPREAFHTINAQSAYREIIDSETAQVAQLQKQLNP